MNAVIKLQKELLQQELKTMHVRGQLVELCRELEGLNLNEELKAKVRFLIKQYQPQAAERTHYIIALQIDDYSDVGNNRHPEVQRIDQEILKLKNKPDTSGDEYETIRTGHADVNYAAIIVRKDSPSDPRTEVMRSINEEGFFYKPTFIDLIQGMTYSYFEKFCNHIINLQDFCTFNRNFWATENTALVIENAESFWTLSFRDDDEEEVGK